MTATKLELRKGHFYVVELYPSRDAMTVWYIREHKGQHLFSHQGNSYIIMDSHWITERNGRITYKSTSSASPFIVSMNKVSRNGIDKYIEDLLGVKK